MWLNFVSTSTKQAHGGTLGLRGLIFLSVTGVSHGRQNRPRVGETLIAALHRTCMLSLLLIAKETFMTFPIKHLAIAACAAALLVAGCGGKGEPPVGSMKVLS